MKNPELRVILIGGPSNVWKSTLARVLASRLGWTCASTDGIVPYPGRPWGHVRPHVVEHYLSLGPDELFAGVLGHYARIWPEINRRITAHARDRSAERLVLEGSALWAETVARLHLDGVAALWLTASPGFLQERIYRASGFDQASPQEQIVIDRFLGRVHRYNERMKQALQRLDLPSIDVEETASLEDLTNRALGQLGIGRGAEAG